MYRDAIRKWALLNMEPLYETERRAVFLAESHQFGPVVLKYNLNEPALSQEYRTLRAFDGDCFCRVFAYDAGAHLLLEERILPGTPLRAEPNLTRRLHGFISVFQAIHHPADLPCQTYLDWLQNAYDNCLCLHLPADITQKMALALEFGQALFEKYPDRCLLHGDFHHDNILLSTDGAYKVIDPKGVIGPAIFDIPRFVLNELDPNLGTADAAHIQAVNCALSKILHYPEDDLNKLFFMETILANVWSMEDGEAADEHDIGAASQIIGVSA